MPELPQDPVTETLVDARHYCVNNDPLVDTLLRQYPDLPQRLGELETCRPSCNVTHSCDQEERHEESQPVELKRENTRLRQQVKKQFRDLGVLEGMLDGLETQVYGHETVIREQGLRIQEQEETISQLNARMQQYIAALVLSAFKNRP